MDCNTLIEQSPTDHMCIYTLQSPSDYSSYRKTALSHVMNR